MSEPGFSLSISNPETGGLNAIQKLGLTGIAIGILAFLIAAFGPGSQNPLLFLLIGSGFSVVGGLVFSYQTYATKPAGIKNNHIMHQALTNRGIWGWILGILLTGMYILIYWFPQYLEHLIRVFDPLSNALRGKQADQWFLYGSFYTGLVIVMGIRMIWKYRHSKYQVFRTTSVMFFQLGFAFLLPAIMEKLNQPGYYFSYFWPLDYDMFFPSVTSDFLNSGKLGIFMLTWGSTLFLIGTPILTFFYGKRWYCSWVCGCGGLANTAGDEFRHLSDKSLLAWKIERYTVYSILALIALITILLWINSFTEGLVFGEETNLVAKGYGFFIGSIFAGVIGVGFYPIFGTRVWCRFGCPMAAYLGILQKYFSRFRITTNGGQCISCGNCSTYCEMGIDVRSYAQRGENIVRAACVGCGICSEVCPRGVLKLENGPVKDRTGANPIVIKDNKVTLKN